MNRNLRNAAWGFAAVLWVGLVGSAWAEEDANPLDAVREDLKELEWRNQEVATRISQLRGKYVKPLEYEEKKYFKDRYDSGRFLFKEKDYVNAAIIFSDLSKFEGIEKRPEHVYVQYYLGASLYYNHNYGSAEKELKTVIRSGKQFRFYNNAVMMLIKISLELNRFKDAERYYGYLDKSQATEGWDMIQYAYGKYLFKQKQYAKALRTFDGIAQSSPKRTRADYFIGTIYTAQGKLSEAKDVFTRLRGLSGEDEESQRVRELATLAVARIYYEYANQSKEKLDAITKGLTDQDQKERTPTEKEKELQALANQHFEDALALYREIPVESPFFDQAYYEITWIYIANRKFHEAANTIDILLLAMPDSIYAPESNLLKGNIELWEREYGDAQKTFQTLVNRYERVVGVLTHITNRAGGKRAEDIQANIFERKGELPLVVMKWLEQEEDVVAALEVQGAIESSARDGRDSLRLAEELLLHLNQQGKANLFPPLKSGRERGKELEPEITLINSSLAGIGDKLSGETITRADRERLDQLQARRKELEGQVAALPATAEAREARRNAQVAKVEAFQHKTMQLRFQLKALDKMLEDVLAERDRKTGETSISQDFMRQMEDAIRKERTNMQKMADQLEGLSNEVAREVEAAKIGDSSDQQDQSLRDELEMVVSEEKQLLNRMKDKLPAEAVALIGRMDEVKKENEKNRKALETFYQDLEMLVAGRVAELSRRVRQEEQLLRKYVKEIESRKREARLIAAKMAYSGVKSVTDRFYDLVLKADVGLVDIAWDRRQDLKERKSDLLERMNADKGALNDAFQSVRGEGL